MVEQTERSSSPVAAYEAAHDAVDDMHLAAVLWQSDIRRDERHGADLNSTSVVDLHVVSLLSDGGDAPRAQKLLTTARDERDTMCSLTPPPPVQASNQMRSQAAGMRQPWLLCSKAASSWR